MSDPRALIQRFPLPTRHEEDWRWFDPSILAALGEAWFVPAPVARGRPAFAFDPMAGAPAVDFVGGGLARADDALEVSAQPAQADAIDPTAPLFSGVTALQLGAFPAAHLRLTGEPEVVLVRRRKTGHGAAGGALTVEVAPGARVVVVELCRGAGGAALPASRIVLGEGARLSYLRVQEDDDGVHLGRVELRLGPAAHCVARFAELGAEAARLDAVASLAREATLDAGVLLPVGGRRRADHHLVVRHEAPRTTSRIRMRALAAGRARAIYDGRVIIAPGASGAVADQHAAGVLLSDGAEIDAKPELIIDHDDVQASHGCAIGRLDPEAEFYLRSRGVPRDEAQAMLAFAFAREAIDGAPEPARRELERRMFARLPIAPPAGGGR